MFSQTLNWLKTFGRQEGGATAIEYGLIAGLVAVATIGSIVTNGDYLSETFTSVQTALDTGGGEGSGGTPGSGSAGDTVAENGTAGNSPDSSAGTSTSGGGDSSSGGIGNGPLDGQDESTSTGFTEDPPL